MSVSISNFRDGFFSGKHMFLRLHFVSNTLYIIKMFFFLYIVLLTSATHDKIGVSILIWLFNKYLSSAYFLPGIILSTGDIAVNNISVLTIIYDGGISQ